jgi:hypothetical protein
LTPFPDPLYPGDLPAGNTAIVVVVRFGFAPDGSENNFVMTAYQIFHQRR